MILQTKFSDRFHQVHYVDNQSKFHFQPILLHVGA